jgi:hypothetical protein
MFRPARPLATLAAPAAGPLKGVPAASDGR